MAESKSIGAQIDELHDLREQLRSYNKIVTKLKQTKEQLEYDLIQTLDAQGIEGGKGTIATVSIQKTTVPTVQDWDAFWHFIRENDAFYLMERRPSAVAYRELLEAREGEAIPGTEPFEKLSVSLRTR